MTKIPPWFEIKVWYIRKINKIPFAQNKHKDEDKSKPAKWHKKSTKISWVFYNVYFYFF